MVEPRGAVVSTLRARPAPPPILEFICNFIYLIATHKQAPICLTYLYFTGATCPRRSRLEARRGRRKPPSMPARTPPARRGSACGGGDGGPHQSPEASVARLLDGAQGGVVDGLSVFSAFVSVSVSCCCSCSDGGAAADGAVVGEQ